MKLKTSKSARKRFRVSSNGKIQHRSVNMNHFNAKDTGDERRHKRLQKPLSHSSLKSIQEILHI